METTIKQLYKAITSDKLSDANKILTSVLEEKSKDRIKTILTNQEDA